nr:apical endosomal glycoprotein [Misgurnus anguillicaudatus]
MATRHWILFMCFVLNICHCAVAFGRVACIIPLENKCDFVCECSDCSDEKDCGYKAPEYVCDFEHEGMCGWTAGSDEGGYVWQRQQRGKTLPDSGPSSDYTIGTSTGWFMGVTAVSSNSSRTAVLMSPKMKHSSPTCRIRLGYFIWDAGHTGLGDAPLWVSLRNADGVEAVVWRPEGISVRGWREDTIYLGRIPGSFNIHIHSRRSKGKQGDVSIDQLEFLDCAPPSASESCSPGFMKCKQGGCVEDFKVCDSTDDCGDGTDEENCEEYMSCNFEDGLCGWDLRTISSLLWTRTNQMNISLSEPHKGPGRDHSNNTVAGHFLYVTKQDVPKSDWASFQSPPLAPTNDTHPCRMVMYTHQFGRVSGGLSVLVAEKKIYPVWERGGSLGDLWVKAEVELVVNSTFQILFVAAIRDQDYGGIAIDDIVLSPECRLTNESMPKPEFPKSPPHPCTEDSKICDFAIDCLKGEDEAQCGDFSYENGSSGWTDTSIGSQAWDLNLKYNDSSNETFLFVTSAPGQQLTEAQTRTPLLGPSGPSCTLQFSYSLTGSNPHIGELSVYVVDSVLGTQPVLWEVAGRTNETAGIWLKQEVYVGAREHRFQLELRARAEKLSSGSQIAVKDVHYVNCYRDFIPSSDLSCNFEVNLCGWYQDQTDNYDWSLISGMDHTVYDGRSLVVDMWNSTLRGLYGRLLSVRQEAVKTEHCLSFFYKLYGPDTGDLAVKLLFPDGTEDLLWMRSGAHGNVWHEGHCIVPPQLTAFQLVFESIRSGFDGQLAIDDVAFVTGSCSLPTMCSFESQTCGYTSSGRVRWVHQNHASSGTGPEIDHSLETNKGFYMLAHSGVDVLPQGSEMTLTSPERIGLGHTECVHFWYHTGGKNPGTLNVYVKPSKGDRIMLFSSTIGQGDTWRHGQGNISLNGNWQLQFEVVGGGGLDTFIAIDDITYSTHSCPTADSVCDFERGQCGWSNTQNSSVDWLDWELTNVQAEMIYSTPPYDHTSNTDEGYFLFLPNSMRDTAMQNAWLLSPHLPKTKATCLSFWAYQPTMYDSKLIVWRLSEDTRQELLTLDEGAGSWKYFSVNITSETEYQIVFEGFKGEKGVLALDDIQYMVGANCGEKKDPTSPSSGNTGAIVASVIVVILLLVILSGLLLFYLKAKQRASALQASNPSEVTFTGFGNDLYETDQ